jgi:hypothetical protein
LCYSPLPFPILWQYDSAAKCHVVWSSSAFDALLGIRVFPPGSRSAVAPKAKMTILKILSDDLGSQADLRQSMSRVSE